MLLFLLVCILLVLIYLAQKATALAKGQTGVATFLETELKEIKAAQERPPASLAYGWFDDGWPIAEGDEEDSAPLENPTPHYNPDDYSTQMYIVEYKSMPSAHQRKEFLRQLFKEGVWMKPELLDIIYNDENAYVRAWAASHLNTDFKDYTDFKNPREIRNYEPDLLRDSDLTVRAALWSNPKCNSLPWSLIWISEGWKEQFQSMSQIERLGLMRNPELSMRYVVALLETPSKELNLSRKEHAEVLSAAAVNPGLVGGSRRTGRKAWLGGGEGNSPFEEYGKMWELCLEKWLDEKIVPYLFIKYIQTTPKVKLVAYTRLLEKQENLDFKWLRAEVIRSCDPFDDKPVLKVAWDDPDEECRKIATERVGRLAGIVGVQARKFD
jgi:hypothetical protein